MSNPSSWQPPGQPGSPPPPPPPSPQQPPFGAYPTSPPPQPNYPYPPNYGPGPAGYGAVKPPRPETKVAGILMLVGAIVIGIGCFIPWMTGNGEGVNGFDDLSGGLDGLGGGLDDQAATGPVFIFFGLVLLGFGIATLAAKRLLPIMIIGIVIAAFSALGALGVYSDYNDKYVDNSIGETIGSDVSMDAGLPVVAIGSAIGLLGAIVGCATRRRWPVT